MNNEWHPEGALVNEISVRAFAVVAEAFAVIGGKDDQRFLQKPLLGESTPEASQHLVHVSQFGLIAWAWESLA